MDENAAFSKKESLLRRLQELDSLMVAFSGGVDSTFLLALAHQVLGEKVVAVTATSPTFPQREEEEAREFTRKRGIEHIFFPSSEVGLAGFIANGPDRCYWCKKSAFQSIREIAAEKGLTHIAHAANRDDLGDYRPGMRAAQELGVEAPLIDSGLDKEEIRFLSKAMNLPTWNKPAMACLASRIPYGNPVTLEKLRMVDEGEDFLRRNGFGQCRVRHHGTVARLELPISQIEKILETDLRKRVIERFREIGFHHAALDLEGYVSGSLNRALGDEV
jgi:uncharacterized protein